jgi:hypothetical protein
MLFFLLIYINLFLEFYLLNLILILYINIFIILKSKRIRQFFKIFNIIFILYSLNNILNQHKVTISLFIRARDKGSIKFLYVLVVKCYSSLKNY